MDHIEAEKIGKKVWDYFNMPSMVEEFINRSAKAITALFPKIVLKFNIELLHSDKLIARFAKKAPVKRIDKYYKVDYDQSSHSMTAFKFQDGFTMVKHSAVAQLNVLFTRTNPQHNELFEFLFPHPDTKFNLTANGQEYTLGNGEIHDGIWFSPDQDFQLPIQRGDTIEFISVIFDRAVLNSFVAADEGDFVKERLSSKENFFFFGKGNAQLQNDLRLIFDHCGDDLIGMMELEGLLKVAIARFLQNVKQTEQDVTLKSLPMASMDRALKLKELIHENLAEKPLLADLAKKLGTNRVTLQKEFQAVYGSSIYQYFKEARMYEAQLLLESGEYSVSEVCYKLGYKSLGHFSRSFQSQYGVNPSTYLSR